MKKNWIKITNLLVWLVSLFVFILAETKSINLVYPWHSAVLFALLGMGIIQIVYSFINKKLLNFGFGAILVVGFSVYLAFVLLKIENFFLGIAISIIVAVVLGLLKNLIGVRSAFMGDNKKSDYKNYKERKDENNK